MEILAVPDLVRLGRGWFDRLATLADRVEGPLGAARIDHGRLSPRTTRTRSPDVAGSVRGARGARVRRRGAEPGVVERTPPDTDRADRLRSQVLALRGRRPTAVTPRLASHAGLASLTVREGEVASLVAAGRTSKEVAVHLGVSVRTVDNLLQAGLHNWAFARVRANLRELRSG